MFEEDISRIFYKQFTTKSLFSGSIDKYKRLTRNMENYFIYVTI